MMKRFLVVILCFIMGCIGLVGCAKEPEPAPTQTLEKSISYYAVIDDGTEKEKTSIPAGMYDDNKTYPAKYVVGKETTVPALVEYEENGFKYTFGGWFSDETLATAFEKIDKTADSDIKIYAKVTKTEIEEHETEDVYSNIEYYYVLGTNSPVLGHYTNLKKSDNSLYPATYKEGATATIGDYEASKTVTESNKQMKYSFGGWFTDASCTTEFEGTIPATATGTFKLYAKITSQDVTPEEPANDDGNWTKNY